MVRHIFDSVNWAKALSAMERGLFSEALKALNSISGRRSRSTEYYALLGTCCLSLNQFDDAEQNYRKAEEATQLSPLPKDKYINTYVRYFISSMKGNEGDKVKLLELAIRQDCPPLVRKWLPLS